MHAFYIPTLLPTIKQLFLSEEESKLLWKKIKNIEYKYADNL